MNELGYLPFERRFIGWIEQNGMRWEQKRLTLSSGSPTVAYRFSPQGEAQRVLFALHGAGNDALFGWIGLFKRELLRASEIFTFDLPGHGRSSTSEFVAEAVADALETALDDCAPPDRPVPVHAIGVSLGGSLLLATLPRIEARLRSAALLVAPLRINLTPLSFLSELRPSAFHLLWREQENYGLTGLIPSFGPFKRDVYPLRLNEPPGPGPFGYVETLNRGLERLRLEDAARHATLPTLLVYGALDRVVPIEQGRRLAKLIPRAELMQVDGGTHLSTPMHERVLGRFHEWVRQWD